jgi:hypothetical protein
MRIRRCAPILLAAMLGCACGRPEPAAVVPAAPSAFVPGQPMTFPMASAGVPEHLGAERLARCRKDGNPDDPECVARVQRRLASCGGDAPKVFRDADDFDAYGRAFLYCVDRP